MTKIMAVNSGSSSLKFQLFDMPEGKVLTSGNVERIGLEMGIFGINVNGEHISKDVPVPNHQVAVDMLLDALINYGIVGLIQLSKGFADTVDMDNTEAMALYDQFAHEALELMKRKNHDYDEAWRSMRVSSYTDLILTKIERIKEIENLGGETLVSEGIDANYMDIINYAVFGVIKLSE